MGAELIMLTTAQVSKSTPLLPESWNKVKDRFKDEYGDATYKSWMENVAPLGSDGFTLFLSAPTKFIREWLYSNYGTKIIELARREGIAASRLEISVSGTPLKESAPVATIEEELGEQPNVVDFPSGDLSSPIDPRFTFDNFVVGKSNELAFAAARRVAEAAAASPESNPLFLYGGVGLGKTHLMHAIAGHIKKANPSRKVVYLSAEKFLHHFIRALRYKTILEFKEQLRSADMLLIDDVQFINGKDSTQEEFFHTFNALIDSNRQLVISCDRSPTDLDGLEERMRSRLGWGLVADIHSTDYELRLGVLESKAEAAGIPFPREVMEFLASRITSNIRELEGAFNRVVAHSTLVGGGITMENATELLKDLVRANDRRLTLEEIQKKVAEYFNLKVTDMYSARRSRVVARPRQIAMYLAKKLTTKSLPEIGRSFGGKDHTTVMHAIKKVEELVVTDAEFSDSVEMLTKILKQ